MSAPPVSPLSPVAAVWVEQMPKLTPVALAVGGRAVVYAGRADDSFGGSVYLYQWPGTHFVAAFGGPDVYFRLGPQNKQVLHVTVDQQPPAILATPKAGTYRVEGLGAGPHRIRVEVVTENQAMPSAFGGFAVPAGVVPAATRQMELIGDSHTLGYGNASPKRICSRDEVLYTTDVERTGGVLAANHSGADYRVIALSGRGVVRNFNGTPGALLPAAYPFVVEDGKIADAGTPAWQPQIVVVSLGMNDFATPLHAGERWKIPDALHQDFEAAYVRFITTLRARYPAAFFILWSTDAMHGEIRSEVQNVVTKLKASGETRVQFIAVNGMSFSACDWHPSLADNRLVYSQLAGFIDAHPQLWQGK